MNVERQDIGVTLRVTPQITEGDTLRHGDLPGDHRHQPGGSAGRDVGRPGGGGSLPLRIARWRTRSSSSDGETVVIGGLISEAPTDRQRQRRCLGWGTSRYLGWLFKTTEEGSAQGQPAGLPHAAHRTTAARSSNTRRSESAQEFERRRRRSARCKTDPELVDDKDLCDEYGIGREAVQATRARARSASCASTLSAGSACKEDSRRNWRGEAVERRSRADELARSRRPSTEYYGTQRLRSFSDDEPRRPSDSHRLLDAGYDGTLVSPSQEARCDLYSRSVVGPFDDLGGANDGARCAR